MAEVPLVDRVGASTLNAFAWVGAVATFGGRALVEAARPPYEIREVVRHLFSVVEEMSDTVHKVNQAIDEMSGDVDHAIQSVAGTVDSANTLITSVSGDVKTITSSGARISADVAEIADSIRDGRGTIGKLVNDDELYRRVTDVAKQADEVTADVRRAVDEARTRSPASTTTTARCRASRQTSSRRWTMPARRWRASPTTWRR
jgi:uncharacterized protein YoxC